jgi:hypothetical protein
MLALKISALLVLASAGLAMAVLATPRVGIATRPRACVHIGLLSAVLAASVVLVQVAIPLAHGAQPFTWSAIATDYVLAMDNLLAGGSYPFFWSSRSTYLLGCLTPLTPMGAVMALAAGLAGRSVAARLAALSLLGGGCLLVVFTATTVHAALATWNGVPV